MADPRITIEYDKAQVAALNAKLALLRSSKQDSVIANTINKVARDFRKWEKEDMKARYTAKNTGTAPIRRASPSRLQAEVIYSVRTEKSGRRVTKAFTTSHFKISKGSWRTGAAVTIVRGRKKLIRKYGNKGFIPKNRIANGSIFARTTGSSLPIEVAIGPTVRGMAHAPAFYPDNIETAHKHLYEELDKRIAKTLAKGKK